MSAYVKAITAFLALLLTNIAADLTAGGQPWPTTGGEWVRWFVTITLGTWLVYQLPNSQQQRLPRG